MRAKSKNEIENLFSASSDAYDHVSGTISAAQRPPQSEFGNLARKEIVLGCGVARHLS